MHNRFVITFTNTDVRARNFPHQLAASDSQTHLIFIARTNNQATHSSGLRIPDLCRCPSPGIGHFTLHTIDARSARSVCAHTAIINTSALVVVVLVDLLATLAQDRHSSATMFGMFLHCVLCCLISWATHIQPSRALVYCECQPGPTSVLIHTGRAVDQQCANPLAAALLLHCTELHTCVRVRPC